MQTEITIIIGAIVTGMITLDKLGVLDKIFRRNGKTRATKNDIDHLAENHLHEVKEILVEINIHPHENKFNIDAAIYLQYEPVKGF